MPWDQEFSRIEQAILQLTAGYDAFLYGTATRPPLDARRELDATFRRLDALEPETAADGFRLASIQTRYTALCERWDRLQADKEEGRRPGVYARFTKEKVRQTPSAAPPGPPNAPPPASVQPTGPPASVPRPAPSPERDLFDRYVQAKRARGEDVSGYDLEHFVETLDRERRKIREKVGDVDVEFDVKEKDGRVRLVARRKGVESA
jgi:hypothetical protein